MIQYALENMLQIWACVAVVCLILELSSGDFFIICFSIGALAAVIASAVGLNIYWQLAIFAVFTTIAIFTVRPVALRYLHKKGHYRVSNADALLGRTGRVTEEIVSGGKGYVQIDGDMWKATAEDGGSIEADATVLVVDRKSTILIVEQI